MFFRTIRHVFRGAKASSSLWEKNVPLKKRFNSTFSFDENPDLNKIFKIYKIGYVASTTIFTYVYFQNNVMIHEFPRPFQGFLESILIGSLYSFPWFFTLPHYLTHKLDNMYVEWLKEQKKK